MMRELVPFSLPVKPIDFAFIVSSGHWSRDEVSESIFKKKLSSYVYLSEWMRSQLNDEK